MEQTPLRKILESVSSQDDHYTAQFSPAVAYGVVVSGGLVMSTIHKAAADFVSKQPRSASHTDLLNITFQFFRPTLHSQRPAIIKFQISNATKQMTVLHVQLVQDKPCLAGYITMTDLSAKGAVTTATNWELSPPCAPANVQKLESEADPNWILWQTSFAASGWLKPLSYTKYYLPLTKRIPYINDIWVSPAWKDDGLPTGAVWTNELVHFVLDNGIPLQTDVMDETGKSSAHQILIRAGLEQQKARREGKNDAGATNANSWRYSYATISITTLIKRLLPKEGVKWLFMRTTTTGIVDDRMDLHFTLMDAEGRVIATSQHIVQIVLSTLKDTKKKPKI